jgi:diguanylate cyclase (GGDEF)-like protein
LPFSGAADLNPEQIADIQRSADRDLARRGVLGAVIYVVVLLAVAATTPLARDFPATFWVAFGVTLAAGAGRLALLYYFEPIVTRTRRFWQLLYIVCVLATAGIWGGIAALAVYAYGIAWTSLLTIVMTAGMCAGALSSMSMNLPLLRAYLVLMLAPSLLVSLAVSGDQGIGLVFVFLAYLIYSLVQGRNMHRDYWEALINSMRLDAETRKRLHELTYHDPLTGLPNRALFNDRLNQAVLDARRTSRLVGVMSLNLDRFMNVNDTLGHEAGDTMLREVGARLASALREGDTVARLAADQFALILPNPTQARDLAKVAKKLEETLEKPFQIRGLELFITASIGIAVYPRDGTQVEMLLKNAEAAMTRVKSQGGDQSQYYEQDMNAQAMERLTLESRLRRALEREEFRLHYQPKVDLVSGRVCGVEALLRWQPRDGAAIPPMQFIPLLEETGLIVPVGEWVLRTACARARAWLDEGLPALGMAVNLSARQFRDPGLANLIDRIMHDAGLPPDRLEIEITESLLMDNSDRTRDMLQRLHAMNLRLFIDDFGTGYSSLGYLRRLPIDTVKIDRSFVRDIHQNGNDATLVRAIIAMAHGLGMRVVAEGVELEEHARFLLAQKCDEIQGYWFCRPLPAEELRAFLDRRLDPQSLATLPAADQGSAHLH